jgi:predicted AAA+ superfamily ATPase
MTAQFKRLALQLDTLAVFRNLLEMPVLKSLRTLLAALDGACAPAAAYACAEVYYALREAGAAGVGAYLDKTLRHTETPFARAVMAGTADTPFLAAAARDMAVLSELSQLTCARIKQHLLSLPEAEFADVLNELPEWETGGLPSFDALVSFYRQNGAGPLALYKAFVWTSGGLVPVDAPDPIRFEEMVGYDWQRQAVLDNTRAFVRGSTVNNVLLYGDSGTGKSATVKSMLNVEDFENLALIEVSKQGLAGLPALLELLSRRPRRFILFFDDLTFEPGDPDYSALKILLEGSLRERPRNVALYVTSNRRQLVKRNFSDRDDMTGDETVQEKTSLADRFGIRLPFFSLNQEDYLTTVTALVRQAGIRMDDDKLKKEALQWALEHGARTPRAARQFVDELIAGQGV